MEELLRAGSAAIRKALREDETLAGFLDPADFAHLAASARPSPSSPSLKPGVDVLQAMNPIPRYVRAAESLRGLLITLLLILAILWLTYQGALHLGIR